MLNTSLELKCGREFSTFEKKNKQKNNGINFLKNGYTMQSENECVKNQQYLILNPFNTQNNKFVILIVILKVT